ncbi:hypothetical protein [Silvibacterium acidisoli]|uniref:hypothetical protein n=1 Tax=Acidobacteriaceae bacterium ZG23-2 TaxID=2883246 RepID=UPI00406C2D71
MQNYLLMRPCEMCGAGEMPDEAAPLFESSAGSWQMPGRRIVDSYLPEAHTAEDILELQNMAATPLTGGE